MESPVLTALLLTTGLWSTSGLTTSCTPAEYLDNQQLTLALQQLALRHPRLAVLSVVGFSTRGVELSALKISAAPQDALVPQVKFIGGIHGNEPPSTHVLLHFAQELMEGYERGEPYRTWLLNNTRVQILPRLNPDGFTAARLTEGICAQGPGRKNARGVDLNRAFPTASDAEVPDPGSLEQEVEAVMRWSQEERFTLSASLHTGSLVVVYPLDLPLRQLDGDRQRLGETADEDVLKHVARTFASNHRLLSSAAGCPGADHFNDSVVRGAQWYEASGTMMDYNYLYEGTMEITVELYCCKFPSPRLLCHIADQNTLALLKFAGEATKGVRGRVSCGSEPLEGAVVTVLGRDMPVFTNTRGHFFRILLPGLYLIQVEMVGMKKRTIEVEVPRAATATERGWVEVEIDLEPETPISREGADGATERGWVEVELDLQPETPISREAADDRDTEDRTTGLLLDGDGLEPGLTTSGSPDYTFPSAHYTQEEERRKIDEDEDDLERERVLSAKVLSGGSELILPSLWLPLLSLLMLSWCSS